MSDTVEEYWTGVASQLQVEAEVFSRLVGHNGEAGRANELALVQLVTRLLPARYGVGTGVVIDSAGGRSKQCDVIVYEAADQPQLLAQSTQLLFPIETVRLVVEVKTTVNAEAIADAAVKTKAVRDLKAVDGSVPSVALFGYQASGAPASRAVELNTLPESDRPDFSCILTPGLVSSLDESRLIGLVPLHQIQPDGLRQSREWVRADSADAWIVHDGKRLPVSRFAPNAPERFVFEPGRALLLFVSQILRALDGSAARSWFDSYVPEVGREVVLPES
jgi:hypothetical protein